jgi:hypothetical protein
LLTFTQTVVPLVDMAAQRIVVDPPAGTFVDAEGETAPSPKEEQ